MAMNIDEIRAALQRHPRYQVLKVLGNGTFGTVALCQDTQYEGNEKKAVKIVSNASRYIYREVMNHRKLKHPHIVQFRRLLQLHGKVGIVMEHANGGNLFDYVKSKRRLQEPMARWFFQQLILAVDYCHRKGVVNRDIKLENLLLHNQGNVPVLKLCDFGYSKNNDDSLPKSMVGSPNYMAPEILNSQHYNAKLCDIWSCGVVLYVMVVGKYPFHTSRTSKMTEDEWRLAVMTLIKSLEYEVPSYLSPECQDLIQKILVSYDRRMSISDILVHPWFLKNLSQDAVKMNDKSMARDEEFMAMMEKVQTSAEIEKLISESMLVDFSF